MSRMPLASHFVLLATVACLCAAPPSASARRSSLVTQPAVRHKLELRERRFEVAPLFEGSVGAQYQHTLSGGVKAEYHVSDALSIGGLVLFGGAMNTGLFDEIVSSLPSPPEDDYPTPNRLQAEQHVNQMPLHGGVHVTVTPWFGKMSIFGRTFVNYDIYASGGFGFAQTSNSFPNGDELVQCDVECDTAAARNNDPRNDGPHNGGFNPGVQFGGGLHVFFNRWMALDLNLRNYMFSDNPSGFDADHDLDVDADDRRFMSHLFVGVGLSLYLPPKIKISR